MLTYRLQAINDDLNLALVDQCLFLFSAFRGDEVPLGVVGQPGEVLEQAITLRAAVVEAVVVEVLGDEFADLWQHPVLLEQRAFHVLGEILEDALDDAASDELLLGHVECREG
ncbi:hypothetical protein D3C85_1311580 [compost metagenome]